MDFIGENLLPGKLGHFFLLLSLVASLAATYSYIKSVQRKPLGEESLGWKKLARVFFITEALSVFLVFGILYYIVQAHLFEYKYAWQHSSRSLEPKYLLAAIWEGQEGSFLLWSIWHCVLGLIVIWREREWEAPVMAVVSFAQVILATMVLGLTVFGWKIGSNPFVLLRNTMDAPIFQNPDYLSFIKDGNDLNPLLQNYWMVIHPPVLFLGFASTLIPFAFAVSGLWSKDYTGWTKAALPWSLFSAGVLGLGIMMGAAWAYESLTFGGYWAWDPVENASLVPWLTLVAAIHGLLIYRHTGNALRTSTLFFILSFLLVLYSTYLTRSGDLQDTSVHAFTGEGITRAHLQAFLFAFVLPSLFIFFKRYKHIPYIQKEEEASSREFWMFVGSLVLFLSALSIILMTSVPVINKIASLFVGKDSKVFSPLAFGEDSAFAYNRIQVFVAIIIGLLSGFGMYLKYKATGKESMKKIGVPALISLVASVLVIWLGKINYGEKGAGYMAAVWLAIAAAMYAAIANAAYIWIGMKGSMKRSGGAIAHLGFALMLIGILISSSKKEVLSYNTSGIFINFGEGSKEQSGENLTLVKGVRNDMGNYWVTYESDSAHPKKPLWFYRIHFEKKDNSENFVLQPNAFVNYKGNEGLMANPDAKHYWSHDVFTYITSLPDPNKNQDTASFQPKSMSLGDTVFYTQGYAVLENLENHRDIPGAGFTKDDSVSVATLKVYAKTGSQYTSKPILISKGGAQFAEPDTLTAESLILQLQGVKGKSATLGFKQSNNIMQYVTLKAYKFPFINVLWLGTVLMVIGFLTAMMRRIETNRLALKKL